MDSDIRLSHPVVELMKKRRAEGSLPGQRSDPQNRLGLIVEGGAVRAIVTAAEILTLDPLGFRNVFDVIYGSSAGASNAAYFCSNQPGGLRIYLDVVNNRRFITIAGYLQVEPILFLLRRPAVDIAWLFNHVMVNVLPLDWEAFARSPVPLKVLAASVEDAEIHAFDRFESRQDLLHALRASATLPILASFDPFYYRGGHYFDSGLLDPYCLRTAIADGCTHLLVLRAHPRGIKPTELEKRIARDITARHLSQFNWDLVTRFLSAQFNEEYNCLEKLAESEANHSGPPFLLGIQPKAGSIDLADWECNRDKLLLGAWTGAQAALDAFNPSQDEADRVRAFFATLDQPVR